MIEKIQKIIPFFYQEECLQALEMTLNKGQKTGLVVMASGLGKTITSALFVERHFFNLQKSKCLFLCHQNDILTQARKDYELVLNGNVSYGYFHGEEKSHINVDIVFSSFQTMTDNLEEFDPKEFDVIVVDETHHVWAPTYEKVIRYFTPEFLLGLTATPDRMDGLDIREIYGEEVYSLPLVEALARKLLSPVNYKLMTDEISSLKLIETPNGIKSVSALNRTLFIPKRDDEIVSIIQEEMSRIQNPRVMIFCSSIEHAEQVAALMQSALPIHSGISKNEKRTRLELFRQGIFNIAITIDMFNEALDIPEANLIVFLRSTASLTVYFQQLGRGLRPHQTKSGVLILDFACNCERISLVYELWKTITEKTASLKKFEINISAQEEPFALNVDTVMFKEKIVPIIELLDLYKKREFYKTWQEASVIAIREGLRGWNDCRFYARKDQNFPACPSDYYKDFPGWNVFLGREPVPEGWLSFKQISDLYNINHISQQTVKNYVKKHESNLVSQYWEDYKDGRGNYVNFYHPDLALKMGLEFKDRKPPPQGWETAPIIAKSHSLQTSTQMVKKIVEKYRLQNPKWFKFYLSKSAYIEHYHPDLVKKVCEHIGVRLNPPSGWMTAKVICKEKKWYLSVFISHVDNFRTNNPEWFGQFWDHGKNLEFYHPDLILAVDPLMISKDVSLDDWESSHSVGRTYGKMKVKKFVEKYRTNYSHWFKFFSVSGGGGRKLIEHFHLELVEKIKEYFSTLVFAPKGWMTCYQIGLEYGTGIKWTRIKKIAELYKDKNPEWFKVFRISKHLKEHYHPELITLIRKELDCIELPPEGWFTAAKLSKHPDVKSNFVQIKKFAETFRLEYPEWFNLYIANNMFVEHYHPNLVKKIKVLFAKEKGNSEP